VIFPGTMQKSDLSLKLSLAVVVVILNFFVFIFANLFFENWPNPKNFKELQAKSFDQSLSQMYLQTLDATERRTLEHLNPGKVATVAIRDQRFWMRAAYFPFQGDAVQIEAVKSLLGNLNKDYQNSVQHQLGLGPNHTSPWAWVTYQFTHHSVLHLLSNLVFLFLIITYLEKQVSAGWIGAIYLLGGIGGGVSFLFFNTEGDLSVIGASGSVCALLAFLMVVKKNKNIPWVYFFAPVPRGYGQIYLPAFLIFPIYLIADFTTMLNEPLQVTAIAHSAHIGGTLVGLGLGSLFLIQAFFRRKAASHGIFRNHDGFDELF